MGLFDFLKGKGQNEETKQATLYSPCNGDFVPIEEVSDPVFSQKMMGDGFGVDPSDGKIYSPGKGKVVSVFPTKHAVGVELDNGIEVLVHIGIDTVELKGDPFETVVEEGDLVEPGTLLSTVDLDKLAAAGKETTVIVILTNMDAVEELDLQADGAVSKGDPLGTVTAK